MRILITLIITLAGCGSGEPEIDPAVAQMTKLCERAHSSTVDSLKDLYTQAGKDLPELPTKEAYAEKCVSLAFTEEQAKCLDPKWSGGDVEGCKETMKPVEEKVKDLNKLFQDAAAGAGEKKGKKGKAGEGGGEAGGEEGAEKGKEGGGKAKKGKGGKKK